MTSPEQWYQDELAAFGARVHRIGPARWALPTPCTEWDVRGLVNHVTGEQFWADPLLAGATLEEVGDRFDGDVLGTDPVASWDAAATGAARAFDEPDAWERTVNLSSGPTLAAEYGFQMTFDLLVHGWDLAVALGQTVEPPDLLVHEAITVLEPRIEEWSAAGIFHAAVPVPPDADEWSRLLGLTGRDPGWQPPPAA